jgi:hypothetical protein
MVRNFEGKQSLAKPMYRGMDKMTETEHRMCTEFK